MSFRYVATKNGLVARRIYPDNPNNLDYGTITLKRDDQIIKVAPFNYQNKVNLIKHFNSLVINRTNKQHHYEVGLHYGVPVHEHFSRNR